MQFGRSTETMIARFTNPLSEPAIRYGLPLQDDSTYKVTLRTMSALGYENREHAMRSYQRCWIYQCSNPECALVGFISDVVLEHRYANGVPCPHCAQQMTKIREAVEGEYDPDEVEALAQYAWPLKIRLVPWQHQQQKDKSDKDFLTEEDLAIRWGVPVSAVKCLVREKKLRCIQIKKGMRVFTQELIDDFLRRESGLPTREEPGISTIVGLRPIQSISDEEARELIRKMKNKERA